LIFAIAEDAPELPPALAEKKPLGTFVAYRCVGMQCLAPIREIAAL
jgi:hypothetical protein